MTKQSIYIVPFQGEGGRWHVSLKYTNGNILSTSPGYKTKWGANRVAKELQSRTGFEIKEAA